MQNVTITISGASGTGKSLLAEYIAYSLRGTGIQVENTDQEQSNKPISDIEWILDKMYDRVKVTIESKQTPRTKL